MAKTITNYDWRSIFRRPNYLNDMNTLLLLTHNTISDQIFVDQTNYEKVAHVSANTVWGVLRGLESFSQLVYNTKEHGYQVEWGTNEGNVLERKPCLDLCNFLRKMQFTLNQALIHVSTKTAWFSQCTYLLRWSHVPLFKLEGVYHETSNCYVGKI